MIDLPDVDTLMAGGLGDWLAGQKLLRAETKRKIRNIGIGAVALGAAVALIGYLAGAFEFAIFLGALVSMIGVGWAAQLRQKMVNTLKSEMNGVLAQSLGIAYQVAPVPDAEFELACNFELLPVYDDSYFQDQWQGQVEGTDMLLYEIQLTQTTGSGKNRRTRTVCGCLSSP